MKTWLKAIVVFVVFSPSLLQAGTTERFYKILDQEWQYRLKEDPLLATQANVHDYNAQLPAMAQQDIDRRIVYKKELLAKLKKIKRNKLSKQDRINYDMFVREIQNHITAYQYKEYLIPINADSGFHSDFARLPNNVPLNNTHDYENYIARLNAFKKYMDQHIALMRTGINTGMILPKVVLKGIEHVIKAHVVSDVEKSIFYRPFAKFPVGVPASQQTRLISQGKASIKESIVPGYKAFLDFMLQEYIPNARATIGASEFPNGREYYAFLVKKFTTIEVTPEEVHQIGLSEVKRIREEMHEIIEQVNFKGSFADFLKFLRTDEQFYAKTPQQLLKEARDISKRMDAKLPELFNTLPRTPYGVEPVPAEIAPKYTTGRYKGTTPGSKKPGYYWVNTYALKKRPLYNLPALTLHEAVPGHHLQISLSRESQSNPNFRRYNYVTVFGEGWGLYSEKLGVEAGIYRTPYEHFGRLSYEMWRACRLVVDTGMHAKGWSRKQAMEYMANNSALSLHNVRTETDRYIAWPGQALAYKMGELKILELRAKSEQALGDKFDIREFHDAVLQNGSVPLQVLEMQINDYIADAK